MSSQASLPRDNLSLRPSLRDLLEHSRAPTTQQLWKALTRAERARALLVLVSDPSLYAKFIGRIVVVVERTFHLRRQTAARKSLDELADYAARCAPIHLPITFALRELHLRDRRPLLVAFLDALGFPHRDGVVDSEALETAVLTRESVMNAVDSLAGQFAPDDVAIYLLALMTAKEQNWAGLEDWRAVGAIQLATAPAAASFTLVGEPRYPTASTNDIAEAETEIDEGAGTLGDEELTVQTAQRSDVGTPAQASVVEAEASAASSDIARRLEGLQAEFDSLAAVLRAAADGLRAGVPPQRDLLLLLESASANFDGLTKEVITRLDSTLPAEGASLPKLRALVERDLSERAKRTRESFFSHAQELVETARGLNGPPLLERAIETVRSEAAKLSAQLYDVADDDCVPPDVKALVSGTHPLCALIRIVRDEGGLALDTLNDLANVVVEAFGEPLARAAMRGRLTFEKAIAEPPLGAENAAVPELLPPPKSAAESPLAPVTADLTVEPAAPPREPDALTGGVASQVAPNPRADAANLGNTDRRETHVEDSQNAHRERQAPVLKPPSVGIADWHQTPLSNHHERHAWRELGGSTPAVAYFHAVLAEKASERVSLPSTLVRAACLAPKVNDALGPVGELVAADLATLDLPTLLAVDSDELQQALRLLVVAAALRPALLAPASVAATQLESLRHDGGFGSLWEFCNDVVGFARGGLALGPDVLSMVTTKAAWISRTKIVQDEARTWLIQKAPAYRFQFVGATNVWRKMLERGNLIDLIVRPVAENARNSLSRVQEQIDALSSVEKIHRQIKRIDRDDVGRPRRGDIHAGALRQLESSVIEALEIARRWVQLQRVDPAGEEGWRLEQAGKLRESLLGLRSTVGEELRMAQERAARTAPALFMTGAVARCAAAVEDLCDLFERDGSTRTSELTPNALLALPLLLRSSAPIRSDGTVDLSQSDVLSEALLKSPPPDRNEEWRTAFDGRLARDDFAGTQLLLDRAELLGAGVDSRERERRQEMLNASLAARRSSVRYEIDRTHRDIARGAALGFLPEHEHNVLLADVTNLEAVLGSAVDFVGIEAAVRQIQVKLEVFRTTAVVGVRERLKETAEVSPAMAEKVEELLDQGDIFTATEIIQNRTEWTRATEIDAQVANQFAHFLRFLRRSADEPRAGANLLADLAAPDGSHEAPDSPENITDDGRSALASWTDRRLNQIDTGLTKRVFSLLGFAVDKVVDKVRGSGPRWQEVITSPVRDRRRCPVPLFGSRANGHYHVLWLWEPTSPEDIGSSVTERDGSRDEAVFVFYFGRLEEAQRRSLRLESLQNRTRFLVIDDILLAYLARLRGARTSAFFGCALPFSSLVPYHTLAGEVPPEMFYGRYRQRADIQDRDGTCLVFGGRQLGKTALLKDVQREFNNRPEGRVAIFADLKATGVGVNQGSSDSVWQVVADELRRNNLPVPGPDGRRDAARMYELVSAAVQSWIVRSPGMNRVLLLLDEADLFFKDDGEKHNFANAHQFKTLMDRTQRAFKVVFAGLHNVQRSTRVVNHPLAHLGTAVCVGPMVEGAEWQAAVDLVERPLAAMGYEIERDLTIRILSHTNYYPSLIQIYCGELLRHVNNNVNRYQAERGPLPVVITAGEVEEAYRSDELRQRIKQSFDLTLNLDPRYKVIALCVAYATVNREAPVYSARDVGVGELREIVMSTWGDGFRADPSEDGFRALLEEMVGLGVLRRIGDSRYALRGANVPLLLGSDEEVFEKLLSLDPPETYEIFEPDTYRRPTSAAVSRPARGRNRAALTTRQEFDLYTAENRVAVICGVPAAGLDDVGLCLETGESVTVRSIPANSSQKDFDELLRAESQKSVIGTTLLVINDRTEWNEAWLHRAYEVVRTRRSRERFVRIVFIAGPERTWNILRDHGGEDRAFDSFRSLGIMVHSLQRWRRAVVRDWLEEQQLSTTNAAFRLQTVEDRTGYWPSVLAEYVQTARAKARGQIVDPGPDFLSSISTETAILRWSSEFGLTVDEPVSVLRALSRLVIDLRDAVPLEELIVLGDVEERRAQRALIWADMLGLSQLHARKNGPAAWRLDGVVDHLLRAYRPSGGSGGMATRSTSTAPQMLT